MDFSHMLDIAVQEARTGLREGGIPIGSALFDASGAVVGTGHNQRVQRADPVGARRSRGIPERRPAALLPRHDHLDDAGSVLAL